MNYQVFARKYRPQDFDSVVGQEHITRTLKNAILQNRLAHAYLFVGPRGVGKTSTARILAKALNCVRAPTVTPCGECDACREIAQGISLDVLEIDGASNNGVEQVRELRENVRFAPTRGKFKIYIIDEVHMLTSAAFNALLKTLEEPPSHVKFIFATTEPQKVLATILSRCQRFDLRRIPAAAIVKHLQFIAGKEGITLEDAAAASIARGAEGGLRDAESMLDQLVAFCGDKIVEEDVLSVFGFTAEQTVSLLCSHILAGGCSQALGVVHQQGEAGKDLSRLMTDLISHFRDLLVLKADPQTVKEELGESQAALLREQAESISVDRLLELIEQFAAAENRMKWVPNKKLHFEVAVIKAIQTLGQTTLTEVVDILAELRGSTAGAATSSPPPRRAPVAEAKSPPAIRPPEAKPPVAASFASETKPREGVSQPAAPEAVSIVAKEEPQGALPLEGAAIWPAVLDAVRERRRFISSWVEAGALLRVEGKTCLIGFPKDQALALESLMRPANRTFIEDLLSEIGGRPLTIRCELKDDLVVAPVPEAPPRAAPDPMEALRNDPLIQKALEIFKGEIQPA